MPSLNVVIQQISDSTFENHMEGKTTDNQLRNIPLIAKLGGIQSQVAKVNICKNTSPSALRATSLT